MTIPIDAAMPATDEPMLDAIWVMFGNNDASNLMPKELDIYSPNVINFDCNAGRAATNSENIGLICVAKKYMVNANVAKDDMFATQSSVRDQKCEMFLCGNARR